MKIYTLDERCLPAIEQVKRYYLSQSQWQKDIAEGKMFGVLIYDNPTSLDKGMPECTMPIVQGADYEGLPFLAAFSGTLDGQTCQPGFVPPVFDIQRGEGRYFLQEEAEISAINHYLESGAATAREVCDLRHERKNRSRALQRWLFSRYSVLNTFDESTDLLNIFSPSIPPGGAGDCCAPKLLQEAFRRGLRPLAIAEWNSATEHFCPPCISRCRPILAHMLRGLNAEPDPRIADYERAVNNLQVIYEDEHLMLVNKPSGLLSVPGKEYLPSVESITQCLSVHRLDQDTSGILLLAKNQEVQKLLRAQFEQRLTQKQYEAILEGEMPIGQEGELTLPLRPDIDNRPKQVVDHVNGKSALTKYRVTDNRDGHAHVILWPHTGRTHQLRVHMAQGLHNPILNDRLYGNVATASARLMLHASMLAFTHPITLEPMTFTCTPEWREPQD